MRVTFVLYEGVEPIDLAAIGVISMARRVIPELSYETVAATLAPVEFSNGLRVLPDRCFDACESVDLLVVPGGPGWRAASADPALLGFIRRVQDRATVCSVCTGAMVLAAAGTLEGRTATTKREVVAPERSPLEELKETFPGVEVVPALVVDDGKVITGGGVSLCIDTMLHVLRRRFGIERSNEVARIIEYAHAHEANRSRLRVLEEQPAP